MEINKHGEKMKLRNLCCWPLLILCLLTGVIPSLARAEVELPEGEYYLDIVDLKIKVLGGYLTVQRTWYQGEWHFNRAWSNPQLEIDAFDGSIESITRNGDLFAVNLLNAGQFFFDDRKIIVPGPNGGYQWRDRRGNSIDYDASARILGYGDRNAIGVRFRYDPQGRRSGVLDHLGNQILWYEYDLGDDRITAVRDATIPTPRRVQYIYQGESLHQVIDAADNTWTYDYNADGTRLERVTDPDGRPLIISYYDTGRVESVTRSDGTGPRYSYDYDESAKEFYVRTTKRSGKVEERWFDSDGEVIRQDVNETTVYTMRKEGNSRISEDDLGNVTVRNYDQWDNLIRVIFPDRSKQTYRIDPGYSVTLQEVDERGYVTDYEYDNRGNLTKKIEATGRSEERITEYDYDVYGNLWKERTLADAVTELAETVYTYDDYGNIDTLTDPEGNVTNYLIYDTMGNPLQWLDGRGKLWQRTYDGLGQLLTETDPLQNVTEFRYDGVGNRTHEIDAKGNITETKFDINNRREAVIDAIGNARAFTYNFAGLLVTLTDEEGNKVRSSYDTLERTKEQVDSAGNVIRYHYGEAGTGANYLQVSRIEYPTFSELYQYDQLGREIRVTRRTVDKGDFTVESGYDPVGNRISTTDEEQRTILYEFDGLNRLIKSTNPLSDTIEATYDDRNNMLSVTNERGIVVRTFSYDRNNRQISELWPTGETWSQEYDNGGNLKKVVDGKGQVAIYEYDDASRSERIDYFVNSEATIPQKTVIFGRDKLGNITSFDDGSVSGIIAYDELNRKTGETINFGPFSKSYQNGYFKNGKRRSFTDTNLGVTEFGYDSADRLSTVKFPDNTGTVVYTDYEWLEPRLVIYPGGSQRALAYDDLQRITEINVTDPAGNPLMDYQYVFDRVGNIEEKHTEHGVYSYVFDELDRLTSAVNPTLADENYDYDSAGNRILSNDESGPWIYDDSNQLKSFGTASLTYDGNGNISLQSDASGITAFEYNLENRLVRVLDSINDTEIASYHYDPFGRRVWKDLGGVRTYFMYSDEGLIAEIDSLGNEKQSYFYKPDSPWGTAPLYVQSDMVSGFYQLDHLGTPQKIVAGNGDVLWAGETRAFGEITERVSKISNPLRFPGQFYDEETGLHYNFFRSYDPKIGRYSQSDPIKLRGGLNSYIYAGDNPVNGVDPLGLKWEWDNPFRKLVDWLSGQAVIKKRGLELAVECKNNFCRPGMAPSTTHINTWCTQNLDADGIGTYKGFEIIRICKRWCFDYLVEDEDCPLPTVSCHTG